MMNKEELQAQSRKLFSAGEGYEVIVEFLKNAGLSKFESMILMVESEIASLGQAKEIVHKSESWAERRDSDDEFHKQIHQAVSVAAKTDDDGLEGKLRQEPE
jgi:hypothetical protein